MPIKDRVKELRRVGGLTQQGLAVKAGLSIGAVVQIEAGKITDPRASTLKALAGALGVSVDELVFDDDAPKKRKGGSRDLPEEKEAAR